MQVERIDNAFKCRMNQRARNRSKGMKVQRGDVGEWRTGE
jgi:hypothetical protein